MCFACLNDPFDLISFAKKVAEKQRSDLEKAQLEASIIKESIRIIEERLTEENGNDCIDGRKVIKSLHDRQYELAKRL